MNDVEYYVYNINEKVEPIEDLTDEKYKTLKIFSEKILNLLVKMR